MIENSANYLTGRFAIGFRFRFVNKAISRCHLYLPIKMKENAHVQALLKGEHPKKVFGTDDIHKARRCFNEIRCNYDFTYWAINKYYIRDINDPDKHVTLKLNFKQAVAIGIIQEFYDRKIVKRFVITKDCGRIGLTTAIQAYIIWRQTYSSFPGKSNICGASDFNLYHMKVNLARFLGRNSIPNSKWIRIDQYYRGAYFNAYTNPDGPRGIDFRYVHMADMSKWHDKKGINSLRAYIANLSGVLLDHRTLIVLEGNRPKDFPTSHSDLQAYYDKNVKYATKPLPYLLQKATVASLDHDDPDAILCHISL